jgi:hypothetical protein
MGSGKKQGCEDGRGWEEGTGEVENGCWGAREGG